LPIESVADAAACVLTFQAVTMSGGGRYGPRNVGAVWISDSQGVFVKTHQTWGGPVRLPNASAWRNESGYNQVDAVTGATRPGHGPVSAIWDCTDLTGAPVLSGTYWISITFAEDNAVAIVPPPLRVARVAVDTRGLPLEQSFADQPNFTAMTVSIQ
jgi:hypothetical protein